MPRNTRPTIFSVEFNKGYEKILAVEQMQNQYDLIKAQEEANSLKSKELELLRQIEENKARDQIKEDQFQQALQLSHILEEITRLCNYIGFKLDDIITFLKLIVKDEEEILNIQTKIDIAEKQRADLKNQNFDLADLDRVIDNLKRMKDEAISKSLNTEFNEFRIRHYNLDVEALFKQLNINLSKITTEDIIKEGSIQDYRDFINKKLLEV